MWETPTADSLAENSVDTKAVMKVVATADQMAGCLAGRTADCWVELTVDGLADSLEPMSAEQRVAQTADSRVEM